MNLLLLFQSVGGMVSSISSTHVLAADARNALCRRVLVNQGRSAGYVNTTGSQPAEGRVNFSEEFQRSYRCLSSEFIPSGLLSCCLAAERERQLMSCCRLSVDARASFSALKE